MSPNLYDLLTLSHIDKKHTKLKSRFLAMCHKNIPNFFKISSMNSKPISVNIFHFFKGAYLQGY